MIGRQTRIKVPTALVIVSPLPMASTGVVPTSSVMESPAAAVIVLPLPPTVPDASSPKITVLDAA